jgi:DNA-binding transcriptional regulator YiaG
MKMKASVETRILERLEEFTLALENQEPIGERFTCRKVTRDFKSKTYDARMVRKARTLLGATPATFAIFLGVSLKTVQAWERDKQPPSRMACRFMDEIQKHPDLYRRRLGDLALAK